ncbi:MAG: phosphoribosylglycinamide formyltransferase [Treponema sp.]|nr:phosphoribosylglycinamide formyltransferase [Treponema sp.]
MLNPSDQANILVLVSGNGTNLQALIDAEKSSGLGPGRIVLVVSDRPLIYALERAKAAGIPAVIIKPDKNTGREERRLALSDSILNLAENHHIDLIVYAGFLWILKGKIIEAYANRMINLHPALLPKYGGKGMFGEHVHRAVLDAGEKESGCTVHLVDAGTDTGPILLQRKVPVLPDDTPQTLAERIHTEEHIAIVDAVRMMVKQICTP